MGKRRYKGGRTETQLGSIKLLEEVIKWLETYFCLPELWQTELQQNVETKFFTDGYQNIMRYKMFSVIIIGKNRWLISQGFAAHKSPSSHPRSDIVAIPIDEGTPNNEIAELFAFKMQNSIDFRYSLLLADTNGDLSTIKSSIYKDSVIRRINQDLAENYHSRLSFRRYFYAGAGRYHFKAIPALIDAIEVILNKDETAIKISKAV